MEYQRDMNDSNPRTDTYDAVIIGAGFAGIYMLYELRKRGYKVRVFDAADEIGGTWQWNRYPGARCDVESMQYSYSFSEELQQEWHWTERCAPQSEILRYLNHVVNKFDLYKDIQLETRINSLIYNEDLSQWTVETNQNERLITKFCIMATGCLSIPRDPQIKGLDQFKGNVYSTSKWPKTTIDFSERRVAVIGTGSSGAQCIPAVAKQASHLYVIQRTPNYVISATTKSIDNDYEKDWKSNYNQRRRQILESQGGMFLSDENESSVINMTDRERFEEGWRRGGFAFYTAFKGRLNDKDISHVISDCFHDKICEIVKDQDVAQALVPYDHLFGSKRPCVSAQYYETFNRDNVTLVDIRNRNIDQITPTGIQIDDEHYEVDDIILATGFDAITGALLNVDIHGRDDKSLRDEWIVRPRTLLGMMIAGFPNLFSITGPGSPIDLSNMIPHIEENVKWIVKSIDYLKMNDIDSIEPTIETQNFWMDHVDMVARLTTGTSDNPRYNRSSIPEKPGVAIRYTGGLNNYLKMCEQVTINNGYEKFFILKSSF